MINLPLLHIPDMTPLAPYHFVFCLDPAASADKLHIGGRTGGRKQTFMAFHVLNAWEERVEINGTTSTQLKVVTCDLFEINLEQTKLLKDSSPGAYVKCGVWCISSCQPHIVTAGVHVT